MSVVPSDQESLVGGQPAPSSKGVSRTVLVGGSCCCGLLLIVVAVYLYLLHDLYNRAVDGFITLHDSEVEADCNDNLTAADLVANIWWPGVGKLNGTLDGIDGEPCYSADVLEGARDWAANYDFKLVSYPARKSDESNPKLKLRGWLIRGGSSDSTNSSVGKRPRIALQHGFTSNSNQWRQVLAAYMLTRLGYDVLVNNFRDHCYSDDSKARVVEWGYGYPYDLLGAWDYLREDPDNFFGGKVEPDKVALYGISMGAFTTVNAFGLDGRVPAAWADAPPVTPFDVFNYGATQEMEKLGLAALQPVLLPPVWKLVERTALSKGIDINKHTPPTSIPKGSDTKRPFFLVGNKQDTTVPLSNVDQVADLVNQYPKKYNLVKEWVNDGRCFDVDHCVDHLHYFDEYLVELCTFYNGVFDLPLEKCKSLQKSVVA